jgi:hypothetical protein
MFLKTIKQAVGFSIGRDLYKWSKKVHGSVLLPALFIAIVLGAILAALYVALYLPVYLGVMLAKENQPKAFYQKHLSYAGVIVILNFVIPISFSLLFFTLFVISDSFQYFDFIKDLIRYIDTLLYSKPVDLIEKAYNRIIYTLFGLVPLFLIGYSAKASFSYNKAK